MRKSKRKTLLNADYSKVRVLLWDIETSFMLTTVFQLYGNNFIQPGNIHKDWYIISAAWKFLGDTKVKSVSVLDDPKRLKKDPNDDSHVIKVLHKVLSDVDAIIGHNGDKFDLRKFNARAVYHGLDPLPEIPTIDTLKIAKHKFMFTSNRLDYLAKYLGVGEKMHTSPNLWLDCLQGKKGPLREMVKYNKMDVDVLEQVYAKLAPFAPAKLNMNLFGGKACPLCGSGHIHKKGVYVTRTYQYQRYQCQECGHGFRSAKSDPEIRATMR